jgi:hypothetical protein
MDINTVASKIADRKLSADEMAFRYAYEARFKEPAPEGRYAADEYFFRGLDEHYDAEGNLRDPTSKIDVANTLTFECDEAARDFGRSILYHDEFTIWFAHDISACDLMGKDIEMSLERLKPQINDAIDLQFLVDLLDAALAKPPQIPEGLLGFFSPDAPPPLHRTQLKRARKWAKGQLDYFESSHAQKTEDISVMKPAAPVTNLKLDLDTCLNTYRYSRAQLDDLLLKIGLVEQLESGQIRAKASQKPWQWASLKAALQHRLLLKQVSLAQAALIFKEAYGAKVSKGTMDFTHNLEGRNRLSKQNVFYKTLIDLLPII